MFLANSIERLSEGRYALILPQDLQQMASNAEEIKDNDLRNVRDTDGILVNFDGTELDSGTVVEFISAKFLNKPAVIYRTDYRTGGDDLMNPDGESWNLMLTNYPRTEVIKSKMIVDVYQAQTKKYKHLDGDYSFIIAREISDDLGKSIVAGFDRQFADGSKSFLQFTKDDPLGVEKNVQVSLMTKMFNHCMGLGMPRPGVQSLKRRVSIYEPETTVGVVKRKDSVFKLASKITVDKLGSDDSDSDSCE